MAWNVNLISFRPLRRSDFPLLHGWLNAEHVRSGWYAPGTYPPGGYSLAALNQDYGDSADGHGPVAAFIVGYGDDRVGYVQSYRVADFLDYAGPFADDPADAATATSLDLFIGDAAYIGRGLGPLILRRFLHDVAFRPSDAQSVIINPDPANASAIRAYEKAGFRHVKTVVVPGQPKPSYVMRIGRREILDCERFPTVSLATG